MTDKKISDEFIEKFSHFFIENKSKKKLKSAGSRTFRFDKGDMWDGDEQIIEWIMWKLGVGAGDLENGIVKQKTYFTIHCVREENK